MEVEEIRGDLAAIQAGVAAILAGLNPTGHTGPH
jgi:hypothetical protein